MTQQAPTASVPSLFELIERSNDEAYELLSTILDDRRELRESLRQSTLTEVDLRLEALGQTREDNSEMVEQYTDDVERLVSTFEQIDGRRLFDETLDEIRFNIRSQAALEAIHDNSDNRVARLTYLLTSNALAMSLLEKLPAEDQERIHRSILAESENLDQIIDEVLRPFGADSDTLLLIGAHHDAGDSRFSGIMSTIGLLPGGEFISNILDLSKSFELLDFYEEASRQMCIDKSTFAELSGMTIGELITIANNVDTFGLDPSDPQDKTVLEYVRMADFAQDQGVMDALFSSFIEQVRANPDITVQEQEAIIQNVNYENLTVDSLIAFNFGNEEFSRNWYQYLGGIAIYSNRLRRFAMDPRYMTGRQRARSLASALGRFVSANGVEARRQRLAAFNGDLVERFDDIVDSLDDSNRQIEALFNEDNFRNQGGELRVNDLSNRYGDILSEHNARVSRWNRSISTTAENLIQDERRIGDIHTRITSAADITEAASRLTNDDWDFFARNFSQQIGTSDLSSLADRHDFIQMWRDTDLGQQIATRHIDRISEFRSAIDLAGEEINQQTRRLNRLGTALSSPRGIRILQEDFRAATGSSASARIYDLDGIDGTLSRIESQINDPVARRRATLRRTVPVAMFAGLAIAPNVVAVARGESNVESAMIQAGQTGLYFIPIVGTAVSIYEVARGRTLSGHRINPGADMATAIAFIGLGLASDVATLSGLGTGAGLAGRASLATARVARTGVAVANSARGSRALRLAAEGVDLAATAANASRRSVSLARVTDRAEDVSSAIIQSNTNIRNTGSLFRARFMEPISRVTRGASQVRSIMHTPGQNIAIRSLRAGLQSMNVAFHALAVPVRIPFNMLRTGGRGLHQVTENIWLRGRQLILTSEGKALAIGNISGNADLIRAINRGDDITRNPAFAQLRAHASRLQDEAPTLFRRFTNWLNDSGVGSAARTIETVGGMAALGTIGISILSQASINPSDVIETGVSAATTTASIGSATFSATASWLNQDHQITDYEQIVRGITSSTLDYLAYNETRDPSDLEGYLEAGIDDPTVQHIARMNGVDLDQLIATQNEALGGLAEAAGSDSGASQEITT